MLIGLSAVLWNCSPQKKTPPLPDAEKGRSAYAQNCKSCHGDNAEGNVSFQAPPLAHLDEAYLNRQWKNFSSGIRGASSDSSGHVMALIATNFSDTSAVKDISAYLSTLANAQPEPPAGDVRSGQELYQSICGSCHGPGGIGNPKLNSPALVNLPTWYVDRQITNFKTGLRGTHPQDTFGAQMTSIVSLIKDDQSLHDILAYLQTKSAAKP